MALEAELAHFRRNLLAMLGPEECHEGKWAVVKGEVAAWPFESWDDALAYGYRTHGLDGFLVKEIRRTERVLWFSRDLTPPLPNE